MKSNVQLSSLRMLFSTYVRKLIVAFFASVASVAGAEECVAPDLQPEGKTIYCLAKSLEGTFEVPAPSVEILVGSYDVEWNEFDGLKSTISYERDPLVNGGRPYESLVPAKVEANAVNVVLRFDFQNKSGNVQLKVNGETTNVPAGTNTLYATGSMNTREGDVHDSGPV